MTIIPQKTDRVWADKPDEEEEIIARWNAPLTAEQEASLKQDVSEAYNLASRAIQQIERIEGRIEDVEDRVIDLEERIDSSPVETRVLDAHYGGLRWGFLYTTLLTGASTATFVGLQQFPYQTITALVTGGICAGFAGLSHLQIRQEAVRKKIKNVQIRETALKAMSQAPITLSAIPAKVLPSTTVMGGLDAIGSTIERVLKAQKVDAKVINRIKGSSLIQYELEIPDSVRLETLLGLEGTLKMKLGASHLSVSPVVGTDLIGVQIPNPERTVVTLASCLETEEFRKSPVLSFPIGTDVRKKQYYVDLQSAPHCLVGGQTNSGKSICLATIVASLSYRNCPKVVQFVIIDPKNLDFPIWKGLPHIREIITDMDDASRVLADIAGDGKETGEMARRTKTINKAGYRNIISYNANVEADKRMPYLVLVIDEMTSLMDTHRASTENHIKMLSQQSRSVGIHIVAATQYPTKENISTTIKSNLPSRIAFSVVDGVASKVILDTVGAKELTGKGDGLTLWSEQTAPIRTQHPYISEKEIHEIIRKTL